MSMSKAEYAEQQYNFESQFHEPYKRRTWQQMLLDLRNAGGSDKDVLDVINLFGSGYEIFLKREQE